MLWHWNRNRPQNLRNSGIPAAGIWSYLLRYYTDLVSMKSFWYHNYLVLHCCAIFDEKKLRGFWQMFPSNLYHKYLFSLAIHNYISGITDDNSHLTTQNSHPKRPPIDITIDFDYWVVGLKLWSSIHACTKTCLRGGPYRIKAAVLTIVSNHGNWTLVEC